MPILGRRLCAAVALLFAGAVLAGCAGDPSPERSRAATPSVTPTPIFTSDAEALAAATEAYRNFLRLSDQVGHEGGARPERVRKFASEHLVHAEKEAARKLADAGGRSSGWTKVSNTRLQSRRETGGRVHVSIYACEDLRGVDVRTADGRSLISEERPDFVAYKVGLSTNAAGELLVVSNEFWTGGGVCN